MTQATLPHEYRMFLTAFDKFHICINYQL